MGCQEAAGISPAFGVGDDVDHNLIQRYLLLGLRLGRHIDGLVDAYYGSPELASLVASEPKRAPGDLARDADDLRREIGNGSQRARWLAAQLEGLATAAERLDGQAISYADEIRRCYGITPRPADTEELAEAHRQLGAVFPGAGPLRERFQAWRRAHEVPADELLPALKAINVELRARTGSLYGLPDGEEVDVETVRNEPWAGFNYYLGGLRSRVVINTDVPVSAQFLVLAAAHECYPGHHTEHARKELHLVQEQRHEEESIFLIATPQSLISEGIATSALGALGDEAEAACESLLRDMGHGYDVAESRAFHQIGLTLEQAWTNVAFMIHAEGRDVGEASDFAGRWLLESDEQIAKRIEFIVHPVWRAYIVLYNAGQRLVEAWTSGSTSKFKRLLAEQLTTSDLLA